MIYRREIDGLRALAVVPVILFHAGSTMFSGGFVGVDVFFVISGYLITSILIDEFEQDNFSIVRFYERRARRILPALFFVMLCCIPFAWMWMSPSELKDFSQSIVAVVFFVSNILFWREDEYFGPAAELKPLLHTWSLAVEEQYYLFFPIFLLLTWRFGRNRVFWSICVIAAISLVASEWGWRNKPNMNFYLAPTRAWQLLAGSMCAFWLFDKKQRANNFLSFIGLMLIVVAIIYYDDSTPLPSAYALAPVLGTVLVIMFGSAGTWTAKLLSMRFFVGIGLISYSAYLWHQPLFAFARIRSVLEPSPYLMTALAMLSLVLAYFSWRYVEKPFRQGSGLILPTPRGVFITGGAVAAAFVAGGLAGHIGNGFDQRFSGHILAFENAKKDKADESCLFGPGILPSHPVMECINQFPDSDAVFLMGDSHAFSISQELKILLKKEKISFYNVSFNGCIPLTGFRRFDIVNDKDCEKFTLENLIFAKTRNFKTLVLSSRFQLYLHGYGYDNGEGGAERRNCLILDLTIIESSNCHDLRRRARVLKAYEARIRALAQSFNVVLVYPIPEAGWNVPNYAFKKAYFNGNSGPLTTSYEKYIERSHEVITLFDMLSLELPNVYAAKVHKVLCNEKTGRCINSDPKGIYYYDDDHLSNAGARLIAPVIVDAIKAANSGT